jgi:hypothetical protein
LISHDLFGKTATHFRIMFQKNVPAALAASPHFFIVLFGDTIRHQLKRKAGPISAQAHYGPAHSGFTEPHQAAAISAYNGKAGHAP